MKILFAGGGSGGHVTPLKPIIESLKEQLKASEVTVVVDRGFYSQTQFLFSENKKIKLKKIYSGKFRRYNTKSLAWHLIHLPTVIKNIRDIFYIIVGIIQMAFYFLLHKPDVVFAKGGFVCIPVGFVAHLFKVPLVIHDSDTHPGLTNRILARWAHKIATGMPTKYYSYPKEKTVYTGIPVDPSIKPVSQTEQREYKKALGFDPAKPLLLVTGGGTGATLLNNILLENLDTLLENGWQISLITGKGKAKQAEAAKNRLQESEAELYQFAEFTAMTPQILAADVVVSRAGATSMQEFANGAKKVLLIPNPYLTGGHQLKNAEMYAEQRSVVVMHESEISEPGILVQNITDIEKNIKLGKDLQHNFAKPHASKELAKIILEAAGSHSVS